MRKSSKASNSDPLFQQTVFKSLQENSKRQEELESLIKSNFMSSKIKSESVEEPEKEQKNNGSWLLRNKIGKNLNSVSKENHWTLVQLSNDALHLLSLCHYTWRFDEMFTSLVVEYNTITSLTDMKPIEITQLRSIFENDFIKMTI